MPQWLKQYDAASSIYIDVSLALFIGAGFGFAVYEIAMHLLRRHDPAPKARCVVCGAAVGVPISILLLIWFAGAW